jgi:hypothetical protein
LNNINGGAGIESSDQRNITFSEDQSAQRIAEELIKVNEMLLNEPPQNHALNYSFSKDNQTSIE